MTTWGLGGVLRFAQAAGFAGDALTDAVGLALAATGGADHYSSNPTWRPDFERRGLFAIRVGDVEGDEAGKLYDPAFNAGVAHALWTQANKSWGWHPAWVSGAAPLRADTVRAILSAQPKVVDAAQVPHWKETLGRMTATAQAIRDAVPFRG